MGVSARPSTSTSGDVSTGASTNVGGSTRASGGMTGESNNRGVSPSVNRGTSTTILFSCYNFFDL